MMDVIWDDICNALLGLFNEVKKALSALKEMLFKFIAKFHDEKEEFVMVTKKNDTIIATNTKKDISDKVYNKNYVKKYSYRYFCGERGFTTTEFSILTDVSESTWRKYFKTPEKVSQEMIDKIERVIANLLVLDPKVSKRDEVFVEKKEDDVKLVSAGIEVRMDIFGGKYHILSEWKNYSKLLKSFNKLFFA